MARLRDLDKVLILEFKKMTDLRILKKADLNRIAKNALRVKLDLISRGFSPITGRRFPRYLNPKRYPGRRKPHTPVNLFLTGDFLATLRFSTRRGKKPTIRFFFRKALSIKKEQGHRDGANGQPPRPIIPLESEGYTRKIERQIQSDLSRILSQRLAK